MLGFGSRLVRFLGEWLRDCTGAFFGNGAIKERLIYTYTEHRLKMIERSIVKHRTPIAKNHFESGNGYVL